MDDPSTTLGLGLWKADEEKWTTGERTGWRPQPSCPDTASLWVEVEISRRSVAVVSRENVTFSTVHSPYYFCLRIPITKEKSLS